MICSGALCYPASQPRAATVSSVLQRSCVMQQCVAVCCSVSQCASVWSMICSGALCYQKSQQRATTVSSVLQRSYVLQQCVAVCCSVLQCVALCFSAEYNFFRSTVLPTITATSCNSQPCVAEMFVLQQCVAVHCSVLQCIAVCCSVLQCASVRSIICSGALCYPPSQPRAATVDRVL